jgi:hypothetical protein
MTIFFKINKMLIIKIIIIKIINNNRLLMDKIINKININKIKILNRIHKINNFFKNQIMLDKAM